MRLGKLLLLPIVQNHFHLITIKLDDMKNHLQRFSLMAFLAVFLFVAKPSAQEQSNQPVVVKTEVVLPDGTAKVGELSLELFPKLYDCAVQKKLDLTLLNDVETGEDFPFNGEGEILLFLRSASDDDGQNHFVKRLRLSTGDLGQLSNQEFYGMHHADRFDLKQKIFTSKPILGVYVADDDNNLQISGVVAWKGAEAAGLQTGDILKTINEVPLQGQGDISKLLQGHEIGDWVQVTFEREGALLTANIQLSEGTSYSFSYQRDPCKVFIGVSLTGLGAEDRGIKVSDVIEGTSAEAAGVQDGDVILAMDGIAVNSFAELLTERNKHQPGEAFVLTVQRNEQVLDIEAQFQKCGDSEEVSEEAQPETPVEIPASPSIDNTLELIEFAAYPNPTVGNLNIRFTSEAAPIEVSISDVSGRILFRDVVDDFDGNYSKEVNVHKGTPGALSLQIMQNGQLLTKQIILLNRA